MMDASITEYLNNWAADKSDVAKIVIDHVDTTNVSFRKNIQSGDESKIFDSIFRNAKKSIDTDFELINEDLKAIFSDFIGQKTTINDSTAIKALAIKLSNEPHDYNKDLAYFQSKEFSQLIDSECEKYDIERCWSYSLKRVLKAAANKSKFETAMSDNPYLRGDVRDNILIKWWNIHTTKYTFILDRFVLENSNPNYWNSTFSKMI